MHQLTDYFRAITSVPIESLKRIEGRGQETLGRMRELLSFDSFAAAIGRKTQNDSNVVRFDTWRRGKRGSSFTSRLGAVETALPSTAQAGLYGRRIG